MVVITLMGGFANQLFQYATARAYALRNNCELYLDLSFLEQDPKGAYTKRKFELDQINYHAKFADPALLSKFEKTNLFSKGLNKLGFTPFRRLNEVSGRFETVLFNSHRHLMLNGYWQNENYFIDQRSELLLEISPAYSFDSFSKNLLNEISSSISVAVHVRRGDYVSSSAANQFHGVLSLAYYQKAAELVASKYPEARFYVFSDDIPWCKQNLTLPGKLNFVENDPANNTSQDLFLMAKCKHQIIANSSYSWWAAWLNINPDKLVIAPEQWLKDRTIETKGLIPEMWIKV